MATAFPAPPGKFVGRAEYIDRFKARVEHFRLFVYGGIPGIGKTSLILRLAKETKAVGCSKGIYLPLWPGETIPSIFARIEARLKKTSTQAAQDRQGDPYARLVDLLDTNRICLIADGLEGLRRENLAAIVRTIKVMDGRYRIIASSRGEPELAATDRVSICHERVGALNADEVKKIAASARLNDAATEILVADANRGGALCHPLTLNYVLAMGGNNLPEELLRKQSARSITAFKALMDELDALRDDDRKALGGLIEANTSITKTMATKVLGAPIGRLVKNRMLDVIDGNVYVHPLVARYVGTERCLSTAAAKTIAKHLQTTAEKSNEPLAVIRAGEVLARVGSKEAAVQTLSSSWEAIRDLGLLEAYLKTLASIEATGKLEQRIKLLSARARMRKANPGAVLEEMEQLATSKDSWTKMRANAALTYIYSSRFEHDKVLEAFEALRKQTSSFEFIVPAGGLAATAMVRVGKITEAEKLAKKLLGRLKGKAQPEREGELHRLLARVFAQSGHMDNAVAEAQAAAESFETAGDLYHAATAYGFEGDLYRETGNFELAKEAFDRFRKLATTWGDRDLIQIAELADAWVSLDVGDLTHASQLIAQVEKDMSAAPSRRLRRYLAAARALLEAGHARHKEAAGMLARVVDAWDAAGQRAIADILRAQQVRSLIACGELVQADRLVKTALERLNANTAAPRVATFLRESALIHLRRKEVKPAMSELSQARKLFAKGGNRREEALTLHRIAHAALDEGDVELAAARAKEVLALAKKIKHARAIALARELQGRVALAQNDDTTAAPALKEAVQSLRKLGDEIGTLHVSEYLLRAQILAGDLASAIRLGPKVRDQAERLEISEVRLRAVVLSGVALLRRSRIDAASRCYSDLPDGVGSPLARAMMWRLGQGMAVQARNWNLALERQDNWVHELQRMQPGRQQQAVLLLEQLGLPPRYRCNYQTPEGEEIIGSEQMAVLEPSDTKIFVDGHLEKVYVSGKEIPLGSTESKRLLFALAGQGGDPLTVAEAYEMVTFEEPGDQPEKLLKPVVAELKKVLKKAAGLNVVMTKDELRLGLPKRYVFVTPTHLRVMCLSDLHRTIFKILGERGATSVQVLQEELDLTRTAARRELGNLVDLELVEAIRDGRGQAFRLA